MQKLFNYLLGLAPLAVFSHFAHWSPIVVFVISALAIIPLAKFLGDATEELAGRAGPAVGGLLNATFGNATELIIGILALNAGLIEVVKASITGSIMGNLLLVLGMAMFLGGLKHKRQKFNRTAAMASASMLFLAIIALLIPAILEKTSPGVSALTIHNLSLLVASLMFLTYFANLYFIFRTHPHLYTEESQTHNIKWSVRKSITVLLGSTVAIAWISEILVKAIEPSLEHFGWTELFVGAVIVAIIGNAAEHTSAIVMATKNRMDLALQIAIGSATQIAMFVVPVLVFAGILMGHEMSLIFNTFELTAIVVSVMIANLIVQDGESNWLEGAQLLSGYGIIAIAFFLHP